MTLSDQIIHVLDLPALYTHPSAEALLRVLTVLEVGLSGFEGHGYNDSSQDQGGMDGLPRYLTGIAGCSLSWIEEDELKEKIWELASKRLSERAGRTAMPSAHRSFQVPLSDSEDTSWIDIRLYEPSLTSDNLGHKTWLASYLLARRLSFLKSFLQGSTSPPRLGDEREAFWKSDEHSRVLELGAGTGLVGIAAAAILCTHVDLTDLPEICENLRKNVQSNEKSLKAAGGSASVFPLDWSALPPVETVRASQKYSFVMAADPLYSSLHPLLLSNAISLYLKRHRDARAVVELPLREAYQPEVDDFKVKMMEKGLGITQEGKETGFDDWADGKQEVKCWWAIWKWQELKEVEASSESN